jgi:hypothetical protein
MRSSTLGSLVCSKKGGLKVGLNPYQTLNGDFWVLQCGCTLCANSMMGRREAQSFCWKFPQMRRYCSISWLTCSDSLSVCGWKAIDSFYLIPNFLQSSYVTCAANCGPQSKIIVLGKPIHFQTLSTSSWLICSVVMVLLQRDRMIALLWQSMTVRILSYPFNMGRSVMKSIVIISHRPLGISVGFSGILTSGHIFVVWHVAHPLMYVLTNSIIPGQ